MAAFAVWFGTQFLFVALFAELFRYAQRTKRWGIGTWFGSDCSIAPIVAQYALGIVHVWGVIGFGAAFAYRESLGLQDGFFEEWGVWFSLAYFVVDSLLILLFDFQNQAFFLLHHLVAFSIGICPLIGISGIAETSQYILVLELSNVGLTAWDLVKRYRTLNPTVLVPAYEFITPIFALTYVPMRTLALPIVTWNLWRSSSSIALSACLVFILGISYKFAFKVASIARRVATKSNAGIPGIPGILSFASLTYVIKAYVSLAWFFVMLPRCRLSHSIPLGLGVLAADAVSILASLAYSSAGENPSLEVTALDYLAVCAKIVVNGMYISATAFLEGFDGPNASQIWLFASVVNVGLLFLTANMLSSDASGRQRIHASFAERTLPRSYIVHFVLSAVVPALVMGIDAPWAAFAGYFAGAVVWTLAGSWGVGAMHVCMTFADVALLSWRKMGFRGILP